MPDRPALQALHRCSGLLLAAFVCIHLVNHALLAIDAASAFAFMDVFRRIYRQPLVEALLLAAVLAQLATGPMLARRRTTSAGRAGLLAAASGYYLLFFLLVHVAAVLWGRLGLGLDTDISFAAAGLQAWPSIAFFLPYYFLAVAAFCLHAGLGIGRLFAMPPCTAALVSGAAGALAGTAIVGGMLALP
ncbi:hypothetical protein [Pseudoduganella albidiflava]|uniref:Succinate dehydrogenase n=1 Tax=Pseudoduganella albidiflava TaxID=321983 RepID=A0A411WYH7_9BURK|nr:hypothetical protein [Pseudoduganella albidiflava]QBI01742.1 hypothetical protein EYF70_13440 [Pseudoduganella albidiflava]GGY40048.1 hypothetical protein GCM10007387_22760 [Pseudoduganella albidiflava]